jgi:hypothetical protein
MAFTMSSATNSIPNLFALLANAKQRELFGSDREHRVLAITLIAVSCTSSSPSVISCHMTQGNRGSCGGLYRRVNTVDSIGALSQRNFLEGFKGYSVNVQIQWFCLTLGDKSSSAGHVKIVHPLQEPSPKTSPWLCNS